MQCTKQQRIQKNKSTVNTDGPMGRGLNTGTGEQVQGRVRVWQVPPPTGIEGLYLSPVVPSSAPWLQLPPAHTHRCLEDLLKPSGRPQPGPAGVDDEWGGAADGPGPSPCLPISPSPGGAVLCAGRSLDRPQVRGGAARSRDSRSSSAPPASCAPHSCCITRTPIPGSASATPAPRHTAQLQQTC